jgi:hypothetical protein
MTFPVWAGHLRLPWPLLLIKIFVLILDRKANRIAVPRQIL